MGDLKVNRRNKRLKRSIAMTMKEFVEATIVNMNYTMKKLNETKHKIMPMLNKLLYNKKIEFVSNQGCEQLTYHGMVFFNQNFCIISVCLQILPSTSSSAWPTESMCYWRWTTFNSSHLPWNGWSRIKRSSTWMAYSTTQTKKRNALSSSRISRMKIGWLWAIQKSPDPVILSASMSETCLSMPEAQIRSPHPPTHTIHHIPSIIPSFM